MPIQEKRGRNDPCPCGSGAKYKKCCLLRPGGKPRRPHDDDAAAIASVPARASSRPGNRSGRTSQGSLVFVCTFVLAFCSIVYELLLGQTLSAFLGNTVLRYCVTIGLYMLSMGFGALLARKRILKHPVLSLQTVEVLLTVLGGSSVLLLFGVDALGIPTLLLSFFAHGLIVAIGILTGLEIPLLIELRSGGDEHAASGVLGVDYTGAFLGTVVFAFWFFPVVGLVPTAFAVASLNAGVGVLLLAFGDWVAPEGRRRHRRLLVVQGALLLILVIGLTLSSFITELSVGIYLGK